MKNRIKQLRKEYLNLTQQKIANKLNISQTTIADYESGRVIPPDRTIADICEKFNVNEEWLRTGKGTWNKEMTEKEKLIARIDEVYNGPDDFHKQALHVLAEMRPEEIKILQIMADRIIEKRQK